MTVLFKGINERLPEGVILAIGIFDGVHLGHQEILRQVRETSKDYSAFSLLMTFEPHPEKVLRGVDSLKNITPFNEKIKLLDGMVDGVLCINFTREFSRQRPEEFIRNYIALPLKPRVVYVGRNFTFGRDAVGKAETLANYGEKLGFKVKIVEPVKYEDEIVSSSRIRKLVNNGEVDRAGALLGRNFYIRGIVTRGKGRKIGFPTANLKTDWELIPRQGVYAGCVRINSESFYSVVNIGNAPTFGDNDLTIEAHILGFNRDIYGKELVLEFIKKIRDELKFSSVYELRNRIKIDIEEARRIFDSIKKEL